MSKSTFKKNGGYFIDGVAYINHKDFSHGLFQA